MGEGEGLRSNEFEIEPLVGLGLINLTLLSMPNAYAGIKLEKSNLFIRTSDNKIFCLSQPVQGLASAGTIAPAVLFQLFRNFLRKLRKKYPGHYIAGSSYSDNCLVVSNLAPLDVSSYAREFFGHYLNESHLGTTTHAPNF